MTTQIQMFRIYPLPERWGSFQLIQHSVSVCVCANVWLTLLELVLNPKLLYLFNVFQWIPCFKKSVSVQSLIHIQIIVSGVFSSYKFVLCFLVSYLCWFYSFRRGMCDFIQSWSDGEAWGNKQEVRCSVIIYLAYLFTC
jgi:hypothetical protein